ncbi:MULTISPECIES: type II toxin-antitoxin system death-on-curing family toxin [unclassified Sporosarcina]|uniref:type II toxin-antitoxin system death-on-curing family toxin n=1 Tax=unclassified Sporosarcina TaxID=2647733 RepID=UPI0020400846|nr:MULTISPECIES: type II toxin-antitoxin system death-on-curing family toxin [unclassified Sporosarcina]GKV66961.1 death-on-curing family protein [Sporosarcina sp. NCCP-2331]GLB57282.1 death-on-curing family protein [Sporosarcina sp. NCCP-2378]
MQYINFQMAVMINQKIILEHSADEQVGVKDHGLLDSALARPRQSLFGEDAYPGIYLKAAALMESLAQNHSFHNGNKRTALMCTAIFFRLNGYLLRFQDQKKEEDFVVDIVKHRYSLEEIADVLEEYTSCNDETR